MLGEVIFSSISSSFERFSKKCFTTSKSPSKHIYFKFSLSIFSANITVSSSFLRNYFIFHHLPLIYILLCKLNEPFQGFILNNKYSINFTMKDEIKELNTKIILCQIIIILIHSIYLTHIKKKTKIRRQRLSGEEVLIQAYYNRLII